MSYGGMENDGGGGEVEEAESGNSSARGEDAGGEAQGPARSLRTADGPAARRVRMLRAATHTRCGRSALR